MLVNMQEMLLKAKKENYAVPHLNINNLEWTKYILEECQNNNSPVILGVSEGAAKYMGGYHVVANMVKGLLQDLKITIPVALHLDHGKTVKACREAINGGFTSVMIDASKYDLETNIKMVNEVIDLTNGQTVEAEIGHIGGTEDETSSEVAYAKVEDCITLVKNTNIDCLAPALGSVHGFYKGEPKLDFEKMEQIKTATNLPLVLHGGTGIPADMIKKAITLGVSKINVNTECQLYFQEATRKYIEAGKDLEGKGFDPRKLLAPGAEAIKTCVKEKMELFGCIGKA